MTTAIMAVTMLMSPPSGIDIPGVSSGHNIADLEAVGEKTLTLSDGKHQIVVKLTVATKPSGWPDALAVGPSSGDFEPPNRPYRIITNADIRVDGCRIDQPWPPIQGMSMPRGAVLSAAKGHWELEIDGPGDRAEDYEVKYAFDNRRIVTRELRWGSDYQETTQCRRSTLTMIGRPNLRA